MRNRVIEITMRQNSVSIALWERGYLVRERTEMFPERYVQDGEIISIEAFGTWLKNTARAYGMKSRHCSLLLPPEVSYVKQVQFPMMKKEEIRYNLPYEFRDLLSGSMEQYRFEYVMTDVIRDESGKAETLCGMALAVSEKILEEYRALIRSAGWKLDAISIPAFVYSDRLREEAKRSRCLIDCGCETVSVYFYVGARLVTYRGIECTAEMHSEQELEWIGRKICQTVDFYQERYPEYRIETIEVCGVNPEADACKKVLKELLGIVCEEEEIPFWRVAAKKSSLNLAKQNSAWRSPKRLLGLAAGMLLCGSCFAWFAVKLPLELREQSQRALSNLEAELAEYQEYNRDARAVSAEYQLYYAAYLTEEEAMQQERYELLKLLNTQVASYGVLQQISVKDQECLMRLENITLSDLSELISNLKKEEQINQVELVDVQTQVLEETEDAPQNGKTVTANIRILLEGGEDNAS